MVYCDWKRTPVYIFFTILAHQNVTKKSITKLDLYIQITLSGVITDCNNGIKIPISKKIIMYSIAYIKFSNTSL